MISFKTTCQHLSTSRTGLTVAFLTALPTNSPDDFIPVATVSIYVNGPNDFFLDKKYKVTVEEIVETA